MVTIDSTIINQVTATVLNEMLELTAEEYAPCAAFPEVDRVVGVIRISGHPEGTVVTGAPLETARRIALTMFAAGFEFLVDSDIHDAVGEIVNKSAATSKVCGKETRYFRCPALPSNPAT